MLMLMLTVNTVESITQHHYHITQLMLTLTVNTVESITQHHYHIAKADANANGKHSGKAGAFK